MLRITSSENSFNRRSASWFIVLTSPRSLGTAFGSGDSDKASHRQLILQHIDIKINDFGEDAVAVDTISGIWRWFPLWAVVGNHPVNCDKGNTSSSDLYMQGNKKIAVCSVSFRASDNNISLVDAGNKGDILSVWPENTKDACTLSFSFKPLASINYIVVQYRNDTSPLWIPCTAVARLLTTDLLWKLSKVSRVVLVLVVDDMPVWLVGLNALRRQYKQITDHYNILFGESVEEHS